MKRILAVCLSFFLLFGCGKGDTSLQQALHLRENLLQANGCTFDIEIAADYGNEVHRFSLSCTADREGNITFSVITPESISGITGRFSPLGGQLTFDNTVLGFPLLADGTVSPVSAPWILLNTLRSGYITSTSSETEGYRLTVNDSYGEDALQLDIWVKDMPQYAEILWRGRRIMTLQVENFKLL